MIDPATVDRIFEAAQIVDVVGEFVELRKRGVNYIGRCPFHDEKTPSFTVSPAKNIFKCFGCGKGGNAVQFIMEHEQLSFVEALRFLAKKYHIEIKEEAPSPEKIQQRNERESLFVLLTHAQKVFSEWLFDHPDGRAVGLSYFKERGLREDTIRKFELGYCLNQRDMLTQRMLKDGFKKEYLTATGLSIEGERGLFDRFWGRVIFPVHDVRGQVVAFGGRVLQSGKDKKVAKYVNSPESDIYHKSNHLYGIYQARQAISKADLCYLVEGYLDVLSMSQSGIENVVASSGTSLTTEQIRLISRYTSNITVIYDGDAAGIKASLRGIDMILQAGLHVKVVPLPPEDDPDSFAQSHSTQELQDYIATHETDFIAFKTQLLLDDARQDPIRRGQLISDIIRSIAVIPDPVMRTVYIQESSKALDLEQRLLMNEVEKLRRQSAEQEYNRQRYTREGRQDAPQEAATPTVAPGRSDALATAKTDALTVAEKEIVRLLIVYGDRMIDAAAAYPPGTVAAYLIGELRNDELSFEHPLYRTILNEAEQRLLQGLPVNDTFFIRHEQPQISSLAASFLTRKYTISRIYNPTPGESILQHKVSIKTEENHLNEVVPMQLMAYKANKVAALLQQVLDRIRDAQEHTPDNTEEIAQLLQQYEALTSLKKELAERLGERVIQ